MTRANAYQEREASRLDATRAREGKKANDARLSRLAMEADHRAFIGVPANDVRDVRNRLLERLTDASIADIGPEDTATRLRAMEGRAVKGWVNRITARATAEQEMARLTKAANQEGEGRG